MRIISSVLMVGVLALWSGCACSDWTQCVLVTAEDVTGTWQGLGGTLELKLEQQGPKVTGSVVWRGLTGADAGTSGTASGAVEGRVSGDVFTFWQTSGAIRVHESDLTVNGDEMTGRIRVGAGSFLVLLQRIDSSRPSSR